MSWWLRAQFLSRVWTSPRPLQNGALCPCSSARAAQVTTRPPVTCNRRAVDEMSVSLILFSCCVTDEGFLGADLSLSSCVVDLSRGPCRDGVCSRAVIHFSPVTDFVKDSNRTTQIVVKSIDTQNFLWNGYSPEPVKVNG